MVIKKGGISQDLALRIVLPLMFFFVFFRGFFVPTTVFVKSNVTKIAESFIIFLLTMNPEKW